MIRFNHPVDRAVIAAHAPVEMPRDTDTCIALHSNGKLLGGVIFTDYTGASIQVHIAGLVKNWANKTLLWICFDYPFNQVGVTKIFAPIPSKNRRTLAIASRLGFIVAAHLRDAIPDDDLVILEMYRHECRWLKPPTRGATEGSHVEQE